MHTHLTDLRMAAPDDDLIDARSDQFTDDRITSGIVGVTVTVWPGFRSMGSPGSTVALTLDLAVLAALSASREVVCLSLP